MQPRHTLIAAFAIALVASVGLRFAEGQLTLQTPLAPQSLTLPNSVTQVVASNPTRRALVICNAGSANDAWITPIAPSGQTQIVAAANGAGSLVISRTAAAAAGVAMSCLALPSNMLTPGLTNTGTPVMSLVTAGFNGITNTGTTPLTVWEF